MSHRRRVSDDKEKPDIDDVETLKKRIRELEKENRRLEDRNKNLEEENDLLKEVIRTNGIELSRITERNVILERSAKMNSTNSSKPPSTDGLRRPPPKSRRVKTGKKQGGQPGHKGCNMPIPHEPDEVIIHMPSRCQGCPHIDRCAESNISRQESRYVVDLVMVTKVTEHRVYDIESCPEADEEITLRGEFPAEVSAYVQYGDTVAITAGILNTHGAMSLSRISEFLRSAFGITISVGTIKSKISRCSDVVKPILDAIK